MIALLAWNPFTFPSERRRSPSPSPFREVAGERVRPKRKTRANLHRPSPNLSLKGEGYGVWEAQSRDHSR